LQETIKGGEITVAWLRADPSYVDIPESHHLAVVTGSKHGCDNSEAESNEVRYKKARDKAEKEAKARQDEI
jgi:hypothetical protein